MNHKDALLSARSMAHQYWQMCMVEAAKAERNGDLAERDKQLDDADRKSGQIRWYDAELAMCESRENESDPVQ